MKPLIISCQSARSLCQTESSVDYPIFVGPRNDSKSKEFPKIAKEKDTATAKFAKKGHRQNLDLC